MPILQSVLGILIALIAAVILWKIFKKLLGVIVLGIILILLLWYFGLLF
ncbi:MAG: hypothetical protein QW751_02825 [Candidatus Aenigmatarchaeota archaeon]|nr:hypothetical protein [Candidatus Aenigmarchaeota archaeon]